MYIYTYIAVVNNITASRKKGKDVVIALTEDLRTILENKPVMVVDISD